MSRPLISQSSCFRLLAVKILKKNETTPDHGVPNEGLRVSNLWREEKINNGQGLGASVLSSDDLTTTVLSKENYIIVLAYTSRSHDI